MVVSIKKWSLLFFLLISCQETHAQGVDRSAAARPSAPPTLAARPLTTPRSSSQPPSHPSPEGCFCCEALTPQCEACKKNCRDRLGDMKNKNAALKDKQNGYKDRRADLVQGAPDSSSSGKTKDQGPAPRDLEADCFCCEALTEECESCRKKCSSLQEKAQVKKDAVKDEREAVKEKQADFKHKRASVKEKLSDSKDKSQQGDGSSDRDKAELELETARKKTCAALNTTIHDVRIGLAPMFAYMNNLTSVFSVHELVLPTMAPIALTTVAPPAVPVDMIADRNADDLVRTDEWTLEDVEQRAADRAAHEEQLLHLNRTKGERDQHPVGRSSGGNRNGNPSAPAPLRVDGADLDRLAAQHGLVRANRTDLMTALNASTTIPVVKTLLKNVEAFLLTKLPEDFDLEAYLAAKTKLDAQRAQDRANFAADQENKRRAWMEKEIARLNQTGNTTAVEEFVGLMNELQRAEEEREEERAMEDLGWNTHNFSAERGDMGQLPLTKGPKEEARSAGMKPAQTSSSPRSGMITPPSKEPSSSPRPKPDSRRGSLPLPPPTLSPRPEGPAQSSSSRPMPQTKNFYIPEPQGPGPFSPTEKPREEQPTPTDEIAVYTTMSPSTKPKSNEIADLLFTVRRALAARLPTALVLAQRVMPQIDSFLTRHYQKMEEMCRSRGARGAGLESEEAHMSVGMSGPMSARSDFLAKPTGIKDMVKVKADKMKKRGRSYLKTSIRMKMKLPKGLTPTQLYQDTAFVAAIGAGLADTLSVSPELVQVTGFEFANESEAPAAASHPLRARLLQSTESKSLKTSFEVEGATASDTNALSSKLGEPGTMVNLQENAGKHLSNANFALVELQTAGVEIDVDGGLPVMEGAEVVEGEDASDAVALATSPVPHQQGDDHDESKSSKKLLGMELALAVVLLSALVFAAMVGLASVVIAKGRCKRVIAPMLEPTAHDGAAQDGAEMTKVAVVK